MRICALTMSLLLGGILALSCGPAPDSASPEATDPKDVEPEPEPPPPPPRPVPHTHTHLPPDPVLAGSVVKTLPKELPVPKPVSLPRADKDSSPQGLSMDDPQILEILEKYNVVNQE